VAPGIFALASLAIVVNAVRESPRVSGAGLLIMAAGIPLYFLMRHLHRGEATSETGPVSRPGGSSGP
jgi:hypothetical protein